MNLDKIDRRLVSFLYHNYREPLTKIAKACNISREQVEYRLKKYEREGLIKKYLTIFNYQALGYNEFVIIRLKVQHGYKEELMQKLVLLKNCISAFTSIGNYNLCANLVFKDKFEFEEVFYNFLKSNMPKIRGYDIFFTTYAELYTLKLINRNIVEHENYNIIKLAPINKLSEKDFLILQELEKNGRAKLIDISRKINIPSDLLVYKLRKFRERKIIQGIRLQLDLTKLNLNFAIYCLKLTEYTESIRKKLLSFSRSNKFINAIAFGISEYNCIIQIVYENDSNLKQIINQIETDFSNYYDNSNLILIEQESKAKTLPI